jgi:hypothetical protein
MKPEDLLNNWTLLNKQLMELSEKQVDALMIAERKGRGRMRVMLRIYNRFSKLRSQREKLEIARAAKC